MKASVPHVFMAYAIEDEKLSIWFKKELEEAFEGRLTIFVASSNDGLSLGRVWFDELTSKLREAQLVLAMVSKSSLRTPWIPFECGTAFGAGKKFIPLYHSGVRTMDLLQPFTNIQGLDLVRQGHLNRLLLELKSTFNLSEPRKDTVAMACRFADEDRLATKWQEFNQHIVPIYWANSSAFEQLVRGVASVEIVVPPRHLDQFRIVAAFCRIMEILKLDLLGPTQSNPELVAARITRGDQFDLLLSRKCAIDDELRRLQRAA